MKTGQLNLKTSPEDEIIIQKARETLSAATGKKETVSKTIRRSLEHLANNPPPTDKPELFFVNRAAIRDVNPFIDSGRKKLQAVTDEFFKVAGKHLTIDELQTFVSGIKRTFLAPNSEVIREMVITKLIEGKSGEIAGLQLTEAKLRELVVIPDLSGLMEAVENLMNVPMVNFDDVFYWNCYHVEAGKVNVSADKVEQVKDTFRSFAATPEEKKKLSMVRGLCEVLNTFLDKTANPEKFNIKDVSYFDVEARSFVPAVQFIKFGI